MPPVKMNVCEVALQSLPSEEREKLAKLDVDSNGTITKEEATNALAERERLSAFINKAGCGVEESAEFNTYFELESALAAYKKVCEGK